MSNALRYLPRSRTLAVYAPPAAREPIYLVRNPSGWSDDTCESAPSLLSLCRRVRDRVRLAALADAYWLTLTPSQRDAARRAVDWDAPGTVVMQAYERSLRDA